MANSKQKKQAPKPKGRNIASAQTQRRLDKLAAAATVFLRKRGVKP